VAIRTWPALLAKEGWLDMERCQSDLRGMRGTFLCGTVYAYMAIMNFINTGEGGGWGLGVLQVL